MSLALEVPRGAGADFSCADTPMLPLESALPLASTPLETRSRSPDSAFISSLLPTLADPFLSPSSASKAEGHKKMAEH